MTLSAGLGDLCTDLLAGKWGDALEHGADVCVSSWNRPAPNTFPTWAKAGGNYLSSQLIAFEAQRPRFLDTPELAHGGCRVAESTQARIDQAIRDIVMGVFERAYRILDTNRAVLERCARELLARETLDENDILQLTQGLVLDGNEK